MDPRLRPTFFAHADRSSQSVFFTQSQNLRMNLSLVLRTTLIFIAAQMTHTRAALAGNNTEQTDILDIAADTLYHLVYPTDRPFRMLPSELARDCNFITTAPSNTSFFERAATPQCTWQGSPSGPRVEIDIEEGSNISKAFMECFNTVMLNLCDIYNREHYKPPSGPQSENSQIVAIMMFVSILICGVGFIAACLRFTSYRSCNQADEENSALANRRHPHANNSNVNALAAELGWVSIIDEGATPGGQSASHSTNDEDSDEQNQTGTTWKFSRRL